MEIKLSEKTLAMILADTSADSLEELTQRDYPEIKFERKWIIFFSFFFEPFWGNFCTPVEYKRLRLRLLR